MRLRKFASFVLFLLTLAGCPADEHADEQKLQLVKRRAEAGDAFSQALLGTYYATGINGVFRNSTEAARWFDRAANQGNAMGQSLLGHLYMIGDGVPQDLHKAAVWFNKAAHQGDPQAAYYLGLAYANGAGLPQDILQAHAWLNIASKLGDEDATAAGRRLERYMTIEQLKGAAKIAKEISAKLPKKQNDQR